MSTPVAVPINAIPGALLDHVPPPGNDDSMAVPPVQTGPPVIADGSGLTVTYGVNAEAVPTPVVHVLVTVMV